MRVVFNLLAAWWPFHPPGIFCKEYYLRNIFRNSRKTLCSTNSCPWSLVVAGMFDRALWAEGRGSRLLEALVSKSFFLKQEGARISMLVVTPPSITVGMALLSEFDKEGGANVKLLI